VSDETRSVMLGSGGYCSGPVNGDVENNHGASSSGGSDVEGPAAAAAASRVGRGPIKTAEDDVGWTNVDATLHLSAGSSSSCPGPFTVLSLLLPRAVSLLDHFLRSRVSGEAAAKIVFCSF